MFDIIIEKGKYIIDKNYLDNIQKYINNKLNNEMSKEEFLDFLELIIIKIERTLYTVNQIKEDVSSLNNDILNNHEKLLNNFISIRGNYLELFNELNDEDYASNIKSDEDFSLNIINDKKSLDILLNTIIKLFETSNYILKLRDLYIEYKEIIESLKYISNSKEIEEYKSVVNNYLNENPIDLEKLKNYLISLQKIILDDFKKEVTDIDSYKEGDYFKFICHSTNNTNWTDENKNYISASLLTPKHMQTYNSGFGFILSPQNIVSAKASDQFTDNTADSDDDLNEKYINTVDSIQKIDKECKTYSEIIIKGFNPIGIFCLTDGSKNLNLNYYKAKRLQKVFPNLKIIQIDLTIYKTKDELIEERNNLINHINVSLGNFYDEVDYELYEPFWDEYLKMKKERKYSEEDIINLYLKYNEINKKNKFIK